MLSFSKFGQKLQKWKPPLRSHTAERLKNQKPRRNLARVGRKTKMETFESSRENKGRKPERTTKNKHLLEKTGKESLLHHADVMLNRTKQNEVQEKTEIEKRNIRSDVTGNRPTWEIRSKNHLRTYLQKNPNLRIPQLLLPSVPSLPFSTLKNFRSSEAVGKEYRS